MLTAQPWQPLPPVLAKVGDLKLGTRPLYSGDPFGVLCDACGDAYPELEVDSDLLCKRCLREFGDVNQPYPVARPTHLRFIGGPVDGTDGSVRYDRTWSVIAGHSYRRWTLTDNGESREVMALANLDAENVSRLASLVSNPQ